MEKIFWKLYRCKNAKLIVDGYPFGFNVMDSDTKITYYRFPFTSIYMLTSTP